MIFLEFHDSARISGESCLQLSIDLDSTSTASIHYVLMPLYGTLSHKLSLNRTEHTTSHGQRIRASQYIRNVEGNPQHPHCQRGIPTSSIPMSAPMARKMLRMLQLAATCCKARQCASDTSDDLDPKCDSFQWLREATSARSQSSPSASDVCQVFRTRMASEKLMIGSASRASHDLSAHIVCRMCRRVLRRCKTDHIRTALPLNSFSPIVAHKSPIPAPFSLSLLHLNFCFPSLLVVCVLY